MTLIKLSVLTRPFRTMCLQTGISEDSVERRFAQDLDEAEEVCVYAKLREGSTSPRR